MAEVGIEAMFLKDVEEVPERKPKKKTSSKKVTISAHKASGMPFKRQRKLTSDVWVNFDFVESDKDDNDGKLLCKCKKCDQMYNVDSKIGNRNLIRHLKVCKNKTIGDEGQMILQNSSNSALAHNAININLEKFRELLAYAVVKHDLPFQFAEYDGIRKCFSYLCPDIKVVSRDTVKADILKMFKKQKLKLKESLSSIHGRISLTSVCWSSSITTDGYILLNAHFIDENWCLQKRVLNFCSMPSPHTVVAMYGQVFSLLKHWGFHKKVFSITLDDASSNDVLADVLKGEFDFICDGDYFHVTCCAHIMNLLVQSGIKEIDHAVHKVRESVKYCIGSKVRKRKFLVSVAHTQLDHVKGLRQDVPTRWNSTYLMLEKALYYKEAFFHLQKVDANYVHCPSTEEWVKIEKILMFLKVFYNVTCAFYGTKYPTANLYFPNVLKVMVLLKDEMESKDVFMKTMAATMYSKFEKYWSNFRTIMAIAVVLDPRFKFQFVEWAYRKIYGSGYDFELSSLKDKLFTLFNAYVDQSSSIGIFGSCHITNKNQDSLTSNVVSDAFMADFDCFSSTESSHAAKSDIQLYLEEQLMPRISDWNILDYWRSNCLRYPVLSQMARDILAIQISTVASKSAFSNGRGVLDTYRSSMKPSTMEALMCLRDWTFGVEAKVEPILDELCGDLSKLKVENNGEDKLNEIGSLYSCAP